MTDQQTSKWRGTLMRYAPLLLWIGVIFYMSSPEGSFNRTSRIIGPILDFLFPDITTETKTSVHFFVRKAAHVIEYLILAVLACRAFLPRAYWPVFAVTLVVAVACADELNQSFTATRTGSPYDVGLDVCGGLIGIAAMAWLYHRANARAIAE